MKAEDSLDRTMQQSPGKEQHQSRSQLSGLSEIDSGARHGGDEFGVAALQGHMYNFDSGIAQDEQQQASSNLIQSLASRAKATFAEFVLDAAGSTGIDGLNGEHGVPGRPGISGANGKDGYGPGRPGKPGTPGKDGKPGTAGKKGRKGTNGTNGARASNVYLSLSGDGQDSVTVRGHMERAVVKQQNEATDSSLPKAETKLATRGSQTFVEEPLAILHRLSGSRSQRPSPEVVADTAMRESSVSMSADGPQEGTVLNFVSRKGVILVSAHGGRGGNGGNGGNGGYGGDGGDGGNGGRGGDGRKGMKPGFNGEDGGKGGDGGAGLAGGQGADGSPAGRGGNAGAGGCITIETTDAKLLMLVEADARVGLRGLAGKPGLGGEGGSAGRGGLGGPGGRGGPPWEKLYLKRHHKYKYYHGCKAGISGVVGRYGGQIGPKHAFRGLAGAVAPDGKEAKDGQVTWILKSAQGEIIERSRDRFSCAVCQFRVRTGSDNGIISPEGTIIIDKVTVWNNGGMTLPEGTRLSFSATGVLSVSSKEMKKVEILPELPMNKRYKCVSKFSMAVEGLDGPTGGSPFRALVSVAPSLELCGRTFPITNQVLEVPVQYPVHILGEVEFPHTVHQGSIVTLNLNLRNISSRSYGQSKKSLGRLEVVVLFFLELEGGQRVEHKWKTEVSEIGAGQDQQLQFDCRVDASSQPYSILSVQVHLMLRGQSIEYRHLESRIIPVYGGADVDAVLVTDKDFKPGVYSLWKCILALLGLKCVFWDISWYQTYSMEEVPWLGKHRLVIFTHWLEDASLAHWLRTVLPQHVNALDGLYGIDNAGAIFVGPTTKDIAREIVDWNNGDVVDEVELSNWFASCWGMADDADSDSMKRPVMKASQLQTKLRQRDSSYQYSTIHISPVHRAGAHTIPLVLFREALPASFRTRAISVQMIEDPAGVELLASSPLLTTGDEGDGPTDIYSGISTAIGGLITTQQPQPDISPSFRQLSFRQLSFRQPSFRQPSFRQPSFRQPRSDLPARPIALDGKYITLGLTLAGLIVSLPIPIRVDILFRLAGHPSTHIPVLSSSGIALTEVIAISFYNDLKSDWLTQRDYFPHGRTLVAEFEAAASTWGFENVIEMESFVSSLTGGLVLVRDELKRLSKRNVQANQKINGMLKQMQRALGEPNRFYIPRAEGVRIAYKGLQRTLPPWLFSYEDELQVMRVLDDRGTRFRK